jgi:tRNA threonylcarbamoyladenosine modification (KEOPS) complex Cgi121 subunit
MAEAGVCAWAAVVTAQAARNTEVRVAKEARRVMEISLRLTCCKQFKDAVYSIENSAVHPPRLSGQKSPCAVQRKAI